MKYYLISVFLLLSAYGNAQSAPLPQQHLFFIIGKSKHGTGDIRGLFFTTEYSKRFRDRLSYSVGISGTINDREDKRTFSAPDGSTIDGSIRDAIAGFQISNHLGYHFIKNSSHNFQVRLGALLRYQTISFADATTTLYPPITGLPIPVIYFENTSPQRTYTIGATTQIRYDFIIHKSTTLGLLGGFQTDTNGDVISQVSLSIGKTF